jgi:hypothetical protein
MHIGLYWANHTATGQFSEKNIIKKLSQNNPDGPTFSFYENPLNTNTQNATQFLEHLRNATEYLIKENVDFALFMTNGLPLSLIKLNDFISKLDQQQSLIGVRQGYIQGKGLTYSPKLPYIDPNFILLNIKNIVQSDSYLQGKLFSETYRHFDEWSFTNSLHLLSSIEATLQPQDIYVYEEEVTLKDEYGQETIINENAFCFSPSTSFLSLPHSLTRAQKKTYLKLIDAYSQDHFSLNISECFSLNIFSAVRKTPRMIKRIFFNKNFEVQKSYTDNT